MTSICICTSQRSCCRSNIHAVLKIVKEFLLYTTWYVLYERRPSNMERCETTLKCLLRATCKAVHKIENMLVVHTSVRKKIKFTNKTLRRSATFRSFHIPNKITNWIWNEIGKSLKLSPKGLFFLSGYKSYSKIFQNIWTTSYNVRLLV